MRSLVKAAVTALALLTGPAVAQEGVEPQEPAVTPAPAAAPPTKGPVPYTSLQPAPRPRAAAPASPPAAPAPSPPPTASGLVEANPSAAPTAQARLAREEFLPAAELEAYVDGVVREAMAREHIAGVTVSVIQNGQVVLKKGYGFASLDPARRVDPDRTLFRIGSISKTFTWIALMKEVEAGHVRLDAPLNLHLPETLQIRDQGFHTPIRVANLMDHSAGFEDRALGHLFERDFARERPLAEYLRQERPRRVRPPGAQSVYSNYGAALAGQVVAYVSGAPFEQYAETRIFRPAGMNRTTFREPHPPKAGIPAPMPPALAQDLSTGFRWTPTGFAARDFEHIGHIAPAGSASSTAGDMARYMQLLLNGGALEGAEIYGPRTAQAFRTPLRRTPSGVNGWRHGFAEYALPGGLSGFGHSGATLSFVSNMVVVPDLNLGIFVAANTETGGDLAQQLPNQLIQQFYAAPEPPPREGVRGLIAARDLYEGYYVGTRRAYGGLEGFVGLLRTGLEVSVTPDGKLVTQREGRTRIWVPEGDPRAGRFVAAIGDERLVFEMSDGKARRILPENGAQTYERAPFWKHPATLAILAAFAGVAAIGTLVGVVVRNRREFRQTSVQRQASLVQNTQAVLWLAAMVLFAVWAAGTADVARVVYGWPGPWLVIASACVLLASALTVVGLALTPPVWRGGRRVDSWSPLRKLGFTYTALLYAAFALVLGFWGALTPWSG
ncbi:MAG: serine hydrolase [Phenylobacterium sp.]|uniref:serine hydrolase n=1 Tax=Phenylobacterium sp. TaxID=1871053 RepID=UPI0039190B01